MHAFDTEDTPGRMVLTVAEPGVLLLQGDGVRELVPSRAGPAHMTTLWEREVAGGWVAWMDMRFTAPERHRSRPGVACSPAPTAMAG